MNAHQLILFRHVFVSFTVLLSLLLLLLLLLLLDGPPGTEECPIRSVVNRVGHQLHKALAEKGIALLVNHGISEEKVSAFTLHYTLRMCPRCVRVMSDLATDFKRLSALLLQALAVGMELPYSYFVEKHRHILDGEGENQSTFRLLYYPPLIEDDGKNELLRGTCKYSQQRCTKDEIDLSLPEDYRARVREEQEALEQQEQQVTRCGAHADYGTFTLLAQDSEGGLEVKLPGTDRWKRVGHLPGAILINAGELLATWTGEKISALQHRVIIPSEESIRTRGRHSLAFFVHPDNCISITPIDLPASSSSNSLDTDEKKAKGRKKSFKTAKNNYINYSNIAANLLRKALKPELRAQAARREESHIKLTKWKEGKPEQTQQQQTE
uniref:Uncharacterized protein n=1 Tax=Anopheles albimanus TaxID=7167 RepID=A0A182FAX9_ANOAL